MTAQYAVLSCGMLQHDISHPGRPPAECGTVMKHPQCYDLSRNPSSGLFRQLAVFVVAILARLPIVIRS